MVNQSFECYLTLFNPGVVSIVEIDFGDGDIKYLEISSLVQKVEKIYTYPKIFYPKISLQNSTISVDLKTTVIS